MDKKISIIISILSLLLPLGIAIVRLRHLNMALKLFFYFLVYSFGVEIVGSVLLGFNELPNSFIFNIFSLIEMIVYSFLLLVFRKPVNFESKIITYTLAIMVGWLLTTWIKGYLQFASPERTMWDYFVLGLNQFNQYFLAIKSIVLIVLSAMLLLHLSHNSFNLPTDSRFWICLGVLVYFTINIAIFSTYFIPIVGIGNVKETLGRHAWLIHNVINVISNILFAIGLMHSKHLVR